MEYYLIFSGDRTADDVAAGIVNFDSRATIFSSFHSVTLIKTTLEKVQLIQLLNLAECDIEYMCQDVFSKPSGLRL